MAFMIGGAALLAVALITPSARDLLTPLRRDFWPIASLSIFGMTAGQFLFHWALDYASVVEVATLVTMPIWSCLSPTGRRHGHRPRQTDQRRRRFPRLCVFAVRWLRGQVGAGGNLTGLLMAVGCAVMGRFIWF